MNSAIVAMTIEMGAEGKVMDSLCQVSAVHECYIVYGVYDIVAKVQASSEDDMSRTISTIRELPGVRSTLTLVVCKEHKR
ncbi:MAG: Lrp/AsnC ligand binding domain-containing protein [Methanomassiliicoccales archaeon]|nr:Lrp/AsnC ligand binding domain-containing protein [Methanomassiliicoccales archaeon]